ncbi:MAG: hypothetical protein HYX65_02035 [Gemmatimonadetes bacterium]|nr:hypothetical protein [Gemmatimonadota bacterium]
MTAARRGATHSVDLVLLTQRDGTLAVLVQSGAGKGVALPWSTPRSADALVQSARQLARSAAGAEPGWLEQLSAFGGDERHPAGAAVSVAFVGVIGAAAARATKGAQWMAVDGAAGFAPRQSAMLAAAISAIRARLDHSPIAFKLLPATFTLSDLQAMYELLLGRRLHKASFRRSLQAAYLVEPTDEWRSEGRGRPAQLYRYAPRKRRTSRRGVRFELLAG